MSKKHFEAIARACKSNKPEPDRDLLLSCWEAQVRAIATALAQTNPRFDRERFIQACN